MNDAVWENKTLQALTLSGLLYVWEALSLKLNWFLSFFPLVDPPYTTKNTNKHNKSSRHTIDWEIFVVKILARFIIATWQVVKIFTVYNYNLELTHMKFQEFV